MLYVNMGERKRYAMGTQHCCDVGDCEHSVPVVRVPAHFDFNRTPERLAVSANKNGNRGVRLLPGVLSPDRDRIIFGRRAQSIPASELRHGRAVDIPVLDW